MLEHTEYHMKMCWNRLELEESSKMISTIQVDYRLQCMLNCTMSPTCDSCNYRPSDKT